MIPEAQEYQNNDVDFHLAALGFRVLLLWMLAHCHAVLAYWDTLINREPFEVISNTCSCAHEYMLFSVQVKCKYYIGCGNEISCWPPIPAPFALLSMYT